MILRRVITKLGVVKGTLVFTVFCVLFSLIIYLIIAYFTGSIRLFGAVGVFMTLIIPAIVAPSVCVLLIRITLSLYRAQEEILKARGELEKRVEDRTQELKTANEQLKKEIEERKQVEQDLRESEARFRILSENSLSGIYIIQNGRFRYVNPALAAMLGYTREELIDKDAMVPVHPGDHAFVAENIKKRLEGREAGAQYVFRGVCKNGETIFLEVLGALIDFDNYPSIIGNVLNITDRKHAEEALNQGDFVLTS